MAALYRVETDMRTHDVSYVVSRSGDKARILVDDLDTAYRVADLLNHHALREQLAEASMINT